MNINKINDSAKLEMNNQFDAELQWFWCDCDCGVTAQKKNKNTIDERRAFLSKKYLANPTSENITKAQSLCDDYGYTYCYCTGTKKTTSWW